MNTRHDRPNGLPYRSRHGMIFGVCQGFADHLDVSVFWIRMAAVIAAVFTGFWLVLAVYLLAAFLMKPAPMLPFATPDDAEFYHTYAASRTLALQRIKRDFDHIDHRIQRIETIVTDPAFSWDTRLNGE